MFMYTTVLTSYSNFGNKDGSLGTRGSSLLVRLGRHGTRLSSVVKAFGRIRRNFHGVGTTRDHMSLRHNAVARGSTDTGRRVTSSVRFVSGRVRRGGTRVTGLRTRLGGDDCGSTRVGGTITTLATRLGTGRRHVRRLRARLTSGGVHVRRLSTTMDSLSTTGRALITRGRTGTGAITRRSGDLGTT